MAGTQEQTTMTFTNVTADAVVTTEWLSTAGTTLVVRLPAAVPLGDRRV